MRTQLVGPQLARRIIRPLLAATLGIAITLTLSCSDNKDDNGGRSNLSDLPKQAYLAVLDADGENIVTREKYNDNGDIYLGDNNTVGIIQNGQVSLSLPKIDLGYEYLKLKYFRSYCEECNVSPENLAWGYVKQLSVTIPGKSNCEIALEDGTYDRWRGVLSYFSESGKVTGKSCEYDDDGDGECDMYDNYDLSFSEGWNIIYYNREDNIKTFTSDLSKTSGKLEWWIICEEETHYELCAKNPNSTECLAGRWYLEKIEGGNSNCMSNGGNLELKANGEFRFVGSYDIYNDIEKNGIWELNEAVMKINCIIGGCNSDIGYPINATIEIGKSGNELRLTTSGYTGFLQCSIGSQATSFTEVFSWQSSN